MFHPSQAACVKQQLPNDSTLGVRKIEPFFPAELLANFSQH
jgi:hypothetical protein